MSWQAPNLASRPFANQRPPRRLGLALAALALALTAWNIGTWWRSGASDAERMAELERLTEATREAVARTATLEAELATSDVAAFNEEATFLNARIAERVFSWNRLFDHLTEVLPRGVRLRQLAPVRETEMRGSGSARRRTTRTTPADGIGDERVALSLQGDAENDEALFEFVDLLFANPRFRSPNLSNQSTTRTGEVSFNLTVLYERTARDLAQEQSEPAADEVPHVEPAAGEVTEPAGEPLTTDEEAG